ncbi:MULTISPECIES: hypothetical protein [Salinibaculum]|uniref:hypothetical protein n=1 Tax=Salinibaculum TaxID=2732368 RepID=UPI0030D21ED8
MAVDISLFVSLLFVVIIEIGGIARSLDLQRISEEKLPPFFVGLFYLLDTGSQQRVRVPQLGRFNFLHGANLALILLGFILVTDTTAGTSGVLIALVTFTIWALLPLLEVDEYEDILRDGYRPVSYYHHVAMTVATALFVYFFDPAWNALVGTGGPWFAKDAVLVAGCLAGYYLSLLGFLKHLERELDRQETNRLPDRLTKA